MSADGALLKAALLAGSTDAKRRSAQRVAPPSRDDVLGLSPRPLHGVSPRASRFHSYEPHAAVAAAPVVPLRAPSTRLMASSSPRKLALSLSPRNAVAPTRALLTDPAAAVPPRAARRSGLARHLLRVGGAAATRSSRR